MVRANKRCLQIIKKRITLSYFFSDYFSPPNDEKNTVVVYNDIFFLVYTHAPSYENNLIIIRKRCFTRLNKKYLRNL